MSKVLTASKSTQDYVSDYYQANENFWIIKFVEN